VDVNKTSDHHTFVPLLFASEKYGPPVKNLSSSSFGVNETPSIYARARTHELFLQLQLRMSDGSDGRKQRLYVWY
jgi:hypothetical protein